MKPQKTLNSWINLEKEEQSRRHNTSLLQTIYTNQNNTPLTQKQTHRQMEQNRETGRNLCICGQLNFDKGPKIIPLE